MSEATTHMLLFAALALLGLVLSALYSGLETGLYSLNRIRLIVRAARGEPAAIRVRRQFESFGRTLVVLLIGTNASNYVTTMGIAELLHARGLSDWAIIGLEAAFVTPLLFVFAETLPKDLFRTHTDRWTYWFSPFVTASRSVFTWTGLAPIVNLVAHAAMRVAGPAARSPVTARQRMSQLIREGVGAGVLTDTQATLSDRALSLGSVRVSQVMIPWRNVSSIPADAPRAAREAAMRRVSFTRFPVVDARGQVVGVVSSIDMALDLDVSLATGDLVRPHLSFAPTARLVDAISLMREQHRKIAVVQESPDARPLGLVTLKDLVEPLTGKLPAW